MLIKDLWVIATSGLSLYRYSAPYSGYSDIEDSLFGGFIAALSTFARSLSQKQIEFVALGNDEIYFINLEEIIVVAIISGGEATQQQVIDQLLEFVGEKFMQLYGEHILQAVFDWQTIHKDFTSEIEFIIAMDADVYSELKREMINKLFDEIIQGGLPPDLLLWKVSGLFQESNPEEILKTVEIFENLAQMLPSMVTDVILETQIQDVFQRITYQLRSRLPQHNESQLYVVCNDAAVFSNIQKSFLGFGIPSVNIPDIENLLMTIQAVTKWVSEMSFNILVVQPTLSNSELNQLKKLDANVVLWLRKTPSDKMRKQLDGTKVKANVGYCDVPQGCPKILTFSNEFSSLVQIDAIPVEGLKK